MKVKEESEKVGLKLSVQKSKIMASGPITSCEMPVGCITSKNQDCQENYQHLRYAGDTTLIRTGKPGVAKSWT